LVSEQDI
jgi:serine/threonine protein kinase